MAFVLTPFLFFDPDDRAGREQRAPRRHEAGAGPARRLYCARCRRAITATDERIDVNGQHEHACVNPYGLHFHIGCFRAAPGCAAVGSPTAEHTWFPGFAWRVAVCAGCNAHLGWRYEAAGEGFYGLIMARLTAAAGG